ncbi:MAG: glycosyltransferase, partial [Candidatus Omnitrophota bacterium]
MLKRIIQNFVVKTNYWPFTRFYQAYYTLMLKIIIRRLKKHPEIAAIYLIASSAAGDSIYGLSDIDLIIIVKDNNPETKWKVAGVYKKLSRFIPILKYDEMGVYGIEEVRRCYRQTDLYLKYKFFTECKKRGKLLYGSDILSEFNELADIQRNEFILGQLAFTWAIFLKNFLNGHKTDNPLLQKYLCYKVTSDTCKAFISTVNNQELFNRKEALERAAEQLDGARKRHVEKIRALAKSGFTMPAPTLLSDTYAFCVRMIETTVEQMPHIRESSVEKQIHTRIDFDFENLDFIVSDDNRRKMQAVVALVREKYREEVRSVLVSPFDLLHNDPLDEENICLFIVPQRPLSLEAIMEFNAVIGENSSPQQLYLYMLTTDMAISLNRFDPGLIHSALFPLEWMDVVLLYLSNRSSVLLGQPLEYDKTRKLVKNYFSQELLDWVSQHEKIVRKPISDQELIRWPAIEFQGFFWHALRLKLLEASRNSERMFIPLSSKQVCRQCRKLTELNSPWLEEFHEEYEKDLNGVPSHSEAYFMQAIALLKKIYNLDAGASQQDTAIIKRLRISVIIPTFNRAEILKEALSSLVLQTRIPDEVVIVDNNSSDNTKEVAEGFKHRLNIRYVLERTQGTSTARNTGIRNASGDIVVFFDDDCVAEKEWLHYLEAPFLRDPSIGMVGGEILACRVKGTL